MRLPARIQRNATFCVIVSGEAMVPVPGEYGKSQKRFTFHTSSIVYHWNSEYFDKVEMLPGTNPVAAHHFEINEFHYLAFANYQDNKGETQRFWDTGEVLHISGFVLWWKLIVSK